MLDFISFNQNTFPLIYEQDSSLPIVYFKLLFKNSGRAYDEIAGEASFFARLLNEGSDDSFFKELELRAINLSASADFETFDISVDCLKEHFPFAIKKLYSLLLKPNFSDKILSRLKNTVLGELASKNSDFDYLAKRLLDKTVYPYKEFQSSIDGDEKSIKDINLNSLKKYYNNLLNSENLVLCVGGDFKKDDFIRDISPILELFSSKKTDKKHFDFVEAKKDVLELKKQSTQAYVYFASPAKLSLKDKDLYLAKIAIFVLGAGGFGSRIMEEIRVKRGLAYSAYARLDLCLSYERIFGYLQTKSENSELAKNLLREIFSNFIKNGINEYEFEQTKKFMLGSSCLHYESLAKRLNIALREFYQGLKIGQLKEDLKFIENSSLKNLNSYIKEHKEFEKLVFASIQNEHS